MCLANGDVILADFDSCTSTVLASLGVGNRMSDIAQGDSDDTLYGIRGEELYSINITNGSFNLIGTLNFVNFNGDTFMTSLVRNSDGSLLSVNGERDENGELFHINPNTLETVSLGETGFRSAGDLTFYEDDLYLSASGNQLVLIDINVPSNSFSVGTMSAPGIDPVFGVVTVIADDPCSANPTFNLIASGGESVGVVDPNTGATTLTCTNFVNSSIFGAAEVTSDVICSIDIEILDDGQEESEYCGTAIPNLTTTIDPVSPIGTYTYEWREQGSSTVLSTNEDYSPTVTTTTTFECTVIDTGRAAPDNIAVDTITVTINDVPVYNSPGMLFVQSPYVLPAIDGLNIPADAAYFTQPNGQGDRFDIGQQVEVSDFNSTPVNLFVFGTDSNDCDLNGQVVIEFIDLQVTIDTVPGSSSLTICEGEGMTFIATPIPRDPVGTYTYIWSDGLGSTLPNANTISVNPQPGAVYSVSIIDSGIENARSVSSPQLPIDIVAAPSIDDLSDQSFTNTYTFPAITGNNLTGNEAYWTGPGGTGRSFLPGDVIDASDFPGGFPVTIYIFDLNSTCAQSAEQDFELNMDVTNIQISLSATPSTPICEGEQVTVTATVVPDIPMGSYVYVWEVDGVPDNSQINQQAIFNLSSDSTITCTVTDTRLIGTSATDSIFIEVIPEIEIDNPGDQFDTNIFTFPQIMGSNLTGNERYYTGPGGTGSSFAEGDEIDVTLTSFPITIYIFDASSPCPHDEVEFELDIEPVNLSINLVPDSFSAIICAGEIEIEAQIDPDSPIGQYDLQWFVDGMPDQQTSRIATFNLPEGDFTIGCTVRDTGIRGDTHMDHADIQITVLPRPDIEELEDQTASGTFTFPAITGDNISSGAAYFTEPGGNGYPYFENDEVDALDFPTSPVEIFIFDDNGVCTDEKSFLLEFEDPLPVVDISTVSTEVCEGEEITLTATAEPPTAIGDYSYEWTVLGETTVIGTESDLTIIPEVSTTYQCTITDSGLAAPTDQASDTIDIVVNTSPQLENVEGFITQDEFVFSDILGTNLSGNEAYFINTGGQGTSYVPGDVLEFDENSTYPLILFVYDESANGCFDEVSFELTILEPQPELFNIPQFVTPNDDNYHDTWNVEILNSEVSIEYVYIYDRYGKLVKQVVPGGIGWDGTLNNNPLPSSSYWYQFVYSFRGNEIEERGYFALKR